jgi:CheY-like chemotaxis protein
MPEEPLRRLNGMGYLERVASGEILPPRHARTSVSATRKKAERAIKVLLVGGSNVGFSPLSEQLEKSGYKCRFVSTCLDGARLVARASFDLVLCSGRMKDFQLLLGAVRRSSASLFRYLLVEDGCWWVPAVLRGEDCTRAPAFRGTEFVSALDTMAREIKSDSGRAQAVSAESGSARDLPVGPSNEANAHRLN